MAQCRGQVVAECRERSRESVKLRAGRLPLRSLRDRGQLHRVPQRHHPRQDLQSEAPARGPVSPVVSEHRLCPPTLRRERSERDLRRDRSVFAASGARHRNLLAAAMNLSGLCATADLGRTRTMFDRILSDLCRGRPLRGLGCAGPRFDVQPFSRGRLRARLCGRALLATPASRNPDRQDRDCQRDQDPPEQPNHTPVTPHAGTASASAIAVAARSLATICSASCAAGPGVDGMRRAASYAPRSCS
jgi:hypothetical protein